MPNVEVQKLVEYLLWLAAAADRSRKTRFKNNERVCPSLASVTSKKSPNVYKSCPKIMLLENLKNLTPLLKLPKNVGDLGK